MKKPVRKKIKKASKTFIASVVLIGDKAPDFGLGKGVVSTQNITFIDEKDHGWESPVFAAAKISHEDRLIRDTCRVEWCEVKNKKKR